MRARLARPARGKPVPVPAAPGTVAVLAVAPSLMVAVERGPGGEVRDIHLHPGGQGFWVARMAARLGARVTLVAPLGGEPGMALRALVEAEGIEVSPIGAHRPSAVWISSDKEGETATLAQLEAAPLARHEADGLVNAMLAAGLHAGVAVLTGGPPGVFPADRYENLAHDLHALGGTVVADLSHAPLRRALAGGVDVLKVSDEDLVDSGLAAGLAPGDLWEGADGLRERGARSVLISRAERPLLACLEGRRVEASTPSFQPVNHRGAGDAMTGAAAAALARGLGPDDALRLAVAAGALSVTRHGLGTGDGDAIARLAERVEVERAGPWG